jgi:GH15 family glucan-1,4-alpha-glucosidase
MPRDIPVGNGKLLITFDDSYQIRDIYFPHVGQENHAGAGPCRFGVYADVPGTDKSQLAWSTSGWKITQKYQHETLATHVTLEHSLLKLRLECSDVVDFHRNIYVRRITAKDLSGRTDGTRLVRLIHHQDFSMFGTKVGDTAYFDPELNALVHYRAKRYLSATFYGAAADGQPSLAAITEYATGTSGFQGAEGTWRDAEDGHLQGNAITQGAVDSTMSHHLTVPASGEATAYMTLIAGQSRQDLLTLHAWLSEHSPQGVLDRTSSYWRLWLGGTNLHFGNLSPEVVGLVKRSLLTVRTQIDNGGAILAANDSDIMQFSRDTYSYVWPRDGALVADGLDQAGFPDLARQFYLFCRNVQTEEGYFLHKYNPDGSPASSWHPWVLKGQRAMPIQEDETALVVWAIWRHYCRYRDIEFIRPIWVDLVQKAADFMVRYRDPRTGLPLPSYDLWEERWGVHAFTVAAVYGGLIAAKNFAVCFGDRAKAESYANAAAEIRAAAEKHLFDPSLNRFVRRLIPRDNPTPPDDSKYTDMAVKNDAVTHPQNAQSIYDIDTTVDASLYGIFKFGLFDANDPRVESTMAAVADQLTVKTSVGGIARYNDDYYHRVSADIAKVPGNPWFICTLWMAEYYIARAKTDKQLRQALPIFQWVAEHALPSGVLAEQVDPYTGKPLSVAPLTWSHATVVSAAVDYLEKLESLQRCESCHGPSFRIRPWGKIRVPGHATFDRFGAEFDDAPPATLGADVVNEQAGRKQSA